MNGPEDDEVAYYRAVEDHFAALRGTPFLFSPKDFALLRDWWRDGVPLAAVLAGVGEAWERRRERQEDPISSLSYCRHAVKRHAGMLAAAHVGGPDHVPEVDPAAALASLAMEIGDVAQRWKNAPAVEALLKDLAHAVATLPSDREPEALDQTLADLEFASLDALYAALPPELRSGIERDVDSDLAGLAVEPEVWERTRRALSIKTARRLVGLPRLELGASAS
ncbi:MAG: hypothetical protein ABR961_00480 [Thermoanaerobaculaceae bacterium]|jgi:hypothetical protein